MLKFVLWDKKPYIIHEGDLSKGSAHYNGITWNEDSVFVSCAIDTKYVIRIFGKHLETIGLLPEADLHETHQIYWYNDKLYATNTGLNRIEIMDNLAWSYYAWRDCGYDTDHINGIWAHGDTFYITEFRNRGEEKQFSRIKVCYKEFVYPHVITVGNGIHNAYVENGEIYTLTSKPPGLFKIGGNGNTRDFIPLSNVKDSLIRGLARTKDFWYIGVSRWETERDKRHVGDAIILQLDNYFNEVDRIIMPDFGPVCDIRVIDEMDLAHNGIPF